MLETQGTCLWHPALLLVSCCFSPPLEDFCQFNKERDQQSIISREIFFPVKFKCFPQNFSIVQAQQF